MSFLGSGRKEKIGDIESLTNSEKEVLIALAKWDYTRGRANSFSLALKINIAQSTTAKAIQFLTHRGFLGKTSCRSYFIYPNIKELILKEINPPVCEQASESAEQASESASVEDQESDSKFHKDYQSAEQASESASANDHTN